MKASVRAPRLQSKLLGAVSVGLAVVLLCALAGLASAWLKLSTEVPPEVAHSRDAERLQREFRGQVQEWKNVLLRGHDDALRQRHLDAFDSEGRLVEQLARGLVASPDIRTRELAQSFIGLHTQLQKDYHAALQAFAEAGYDPAVGDNLVRGKCAGVRYIRGDAAIIDADYPGRGGITPSGGTTDCANGNPRQASPNVTTSQHFTYSREQSNHATSHDLSQPHPNPNASHATHFGHGVRFDMAE